MPDADPSLIGAGSTVRAAAGRGLTRREGLLALALLAPAGLLAACTGSSEPPPPSATASAPPVDLAGEVSAEESALVAAYDAVLATATGLDEEATALLSLIRDQHAQHLAALGGSSSPLPSPATPAPAPATASAAVASLITAERAASRSRIRACVAADDADLARLLTFIGASEASHVPALRDLGQVGA